jgi:hypothetical protein
MKHMLFSIVSYHSLTEKQWTVIADLSQEQMSTDSPK